MDTQEIKVFKFSDPRQQRIYDKLLEIGPGPAAFFKDACRLWEEEPPLESKTNIIAHCLREIESSVREVMLPLDFKASADSKKNQTSQQEEIQTIMNLYGIDPKDDLAKLWFRIADRQEEIALYQFVHRNALDRSKEADSSFEELWTGMRGLLDIVLNRIEANYLGFFKILDGLLSKKDIEEADIKTLKNKIPNSPVTYSYFFEKLENPNWLALLKKDGFFNNPPLPILHPDSGTSFPYWPQAQYLRKMANIQNCQETVMAICLEVKTENIRSKSEVLDIALLLPPDMAVKVVESVGEVDSWFSPDKYGKLISYFARGGKVGEALKLALKLLIIQPDPRKAPEYGGVAIPHEPIGVIRDWDYGQILENNFPDLLDVAGLDAIKILFDQIETYIRLSKTKVKENPSEDYSEIWRSTIEDHSENNDHNIRDSLINGARDACERLIKNDPSLAKEVIEELDNRKYLIFKRLKRHLLKLFPKDMEDEISSVLVSEEEFKTERFNHEYFLLAEAHASILDDSQRDQIWKWITDGPDIEEFVKWRKQNGLETSDELKEKYHKNWQMYHLMPFKEIDPKWRKYFDKLVEVVGQPDHPSFKSWSEGGSWGPSSALSPEILKEMEPTKLVDFLKSWEPKQNDHKEASREGTGRELTSLIAENPEKLLASLPLFSDLDPTYIRSALAGFRDAAKKGKTFDWIPVLDLCDIVLAKPKEIPERKTKSFFSEDPDWNWSRTTILELIDEGMEDKPDKVNVELKERIWTIIENLTRDSDPTPEREIESLKNRDPLGVAINSIRGDAIQSAIKYGVWLKNNTKKEDQEKWNFKDNAPELLRVLNEHLEIKSDPSLAIRAVYGEKLSTLVWLDKNWVDENQDNIFPEGEDSKEHFDSAWDTFITFNRAFDVLFNILKKQYQRAIEEIGLHTDGHHHLENPEQSLSQHLILFYCRDLIQLDDSLLIDFYSKADLSLRAEVIDFIGRVSKNDKEIPQKVIDRFVNLFEVRLKFIKTNPGEVQEFKEFSWWVASGKYEDKWVLEKLSEILELGCDMEGDHLIIEKFKEIVTNFPKEVITCLQKMVENDKKGWGVLTWADELKIIIKSVLEINDEESKKLTTEFIHRLAAKGHTQFKELLEATP